MGDSLIATTNAAYDNGRSIAKLIFAPTQPNSADSAIYAVMEHSELLWFHCAMVNTPGIESLIPGGILGHLEEARLSDCRTKKSAWYAFRRLTDARRGTLKAMSVQPQIGNEASFFGLSPERWSPGKSHIRTTAPMEPGLESMQN